MNYDSRNKINLIMGNELRALSCLLYFFTISLSAQVTTSLDSTAIRIGEQIIYKIEVKIIFNLIY